MTRKSHQIAPRTIHNGTVHNRGQAHPKHNSSRLASCLALLVCLASAPAVLADDKAEYHYREAVMEAMGGHMAAMGTILKEGVHGDDLALHARGIAALSALLPDIFPAGSDTRKSEALPAIWENREAFDLAVSKLQAAAKDMATAAETGRMEEIIPAVQALGGSCKGCHDDFKEE